MNDDVTSADVSALSLRDLRLRPGIALQTRRLVEGATKKESLFLAAIEGKGVMVGPVGPDGAKTELEDGEVCVVRGFTGQYEFSFLSRVLQTFEKPFVYALLLYPEKVDARLVRQSMRIKTSMPAILTLPEKANPALTTKHNVTLIDISMSGAMIRSPSSPPVVGCPLTLQFEVEFEDAPVQLTLTGTMCHNSNARDKDEFFIGLAFKALSRQDKLILHYMTHSRAG
jgi:hypothetical protein